MIEAKILLGFTSEGGREEGVVKVKKISTDHWLHKPGIFETLPKEFEHVFVFSFWLLHVVPACDKVKNQIITEK
jgi:hypothetical protein